VAEAALLLRCVLLLCNVVMQQGRALPDP
jgi:hypothetical protein